VFDTLELMNDPSFAERGIMQTIDHGAAPTVKPSPLLGQHVDDVLGSWLGMDAKELAALRHDGII